MPAVHAAFNVAAAGPRTLTLQDVGLPYAPAGGLAVHRVI
jgi:hypothetical protein